MVIPAKAGNPVTYQQLAEPSRLDPGFRRGDGSGSLFNADGIN
jgi:hypothetical protein